MDDFIDTGDYKDFDGYSLEKKNAYYDELQRDIKSTNRLKNLSLAGVFTNLVATGASVVLMKDYSTMPFAFICGVFTLCWSNLYKRNKESVEDFQETAFLLKKKIDIANKKRGV